MGHDECRLPRVRPGEEVLPGGEDTLAEVEQALYDRDVTLYEVEVVTDNTIGVAFYESTGFERVDTSERDLFGETVTEYVFRKRL